MVRSLSSKIRSAVLAIIVSSMTSALFAQVESSRELNLDRKLIEQISLGTANNVKAIIKDGANPNAIVGEVPP